MRKKKNTFCHLIFFISMYFFSLGKINTKPPVYDQLTQISPKKNTAHIKNRQDKNSEALSIFQGIKKSNDPSHIDNKLYDLVLEILVHRLNKVDEAIALFDEMKAVGKATRLNYATIESALQKLGRNSDADKYAAERRTRFPFVTPTQH